MLLGVPLERVVEKDIMMNSRGNISLIQSMAGFLFGCDDFYGSCPVEKT